MDFPIFKTKIEGAKKKFNLADPQNHKAYFRFKAGPEIEKLRAYLKKNTFVAYMLGKKNSGKGTYSQMFAEIVDSKRIDHFCIGDMVRAIDEELKTKGKRKELSSFLEKNYRGWLSLKEIIQALEKRSTKTLLPTELILALVKREIQKREKKALFIDGFPRDLDQIAFALFFRDLIGYRDDPDIFILIDIPEAIIDKRIKWRRICPKCQSSRSLKLYLTKEIGYDKQKKEFYLICDSPNCQKSPMVIKEGDEFGIKPIRERLRMEERLMKQALSLHGVPKVLLRNAIPVRVAGNFIDDYEITPEYILQWDKKGKKVKIREKPWIVLDGEGVQSFSLLPPAVVVSLIKQLVEVLNL